jgi:hypothetical protein
MWPVSVWPPLMQHFVDGSGLARDLLLGLAMRSAW